MTEPVLNDPADPSQARPGAQAAGPAATPPASAVPWERNVLEQWMQGQLAEQRVARRWSHQKRSVAPGTQSNKLPSGTSTFFSSRS